MSVISNYIESIEHNLPNGFEFVENPKMGFYSYPALDSQRGVKSSICFTLKGPNGKEKEFEMTKLTEWSTNSQQIMIDAFRYILSEAFKDPYFMEPYLGFKLI